MTDQKPYTLDRIVRIGILFNRIAAEHIAGPVHRAVEHDSLSSDPGPDPRRAAGSDACPGVGHQCLDDLRSHRPGFRGGADYSGHHPGTKNNGQGHRVKPGHDDAVTLHIESFIPHIFLLLADYIEVLQISGAA